MPPKKKDCFLGSIWLSRYCVHLFYHIVSPTETQYWLIGCKPNPYFNKKADKQIHCIGYVVDVPRLVQVLLRTIK